MEIQLLESWKRESLFKKALEREGPFTRELLGVL